MKKQNFVFSEDNLFDLFDLLMKETKKSKEQNGQAFNEKIYNNNLIIDILSWYGFTPEQIVELKTYDIISEGITGYNNVKFSQRALDCLLEYKSIPRDDNKFLALASSAGYTISVDSVQRLFYSQKFDLPEESDWIRRSLTPSKVYDSYRFLWVYNYCQQNNVNYKRFSTEDKVLIQQLYPDDNLLDLNGWKTFRTRFYRSYNIFYAECKEYYENYEHDKDIINSEIQNNDSQESMIINPTNDESQSNEIKMINNLKIMLYDLKEHEEIIEQQLAIMRKKIESIEDTLEIL
ncbi:MAG: hypothetical protein NC485_15035 [Ruminococcus flavefaciens]|nr:hypothetical protein [Ruminococcus flavefaciens]